MFLCQRLVFRKSLLFEHVYPVRRYSEQANVKLCWDFPGGSVVKTWPSNAGGAVSIPGQGARIPHAS